MEYAPKKGALFMNYELHKCRPRFVIELYLLIRLLFSRLQVYLLGCYFTVIFTCCLILSDEDAQCK